MGTAMRAVVIRSFGDPGVLQVEEIERPPAAAVGAGHTTGKVTLVVDEDGWLTPPSTR